MLIVKYLQSDPFHPSPQADQLRTGASLSRKACVDKMLAAPSVLASLTISDLLVQHEKEVGGEMGGGARKIGKFMKQKGGDNKGRVLVER